MKKTLKIAAVFAAVTAILICLFYLLSFLFPNIFPPIGSTSEVEPADTTETVAPASMLAVDKSSCKPKLVVNATEYHYSMTGVKSNCANPEYTLSDSHGHSYTSTNGKFNTIQPNSSASYTITVTDTVTGDMSAPLTITGFKEMTPVDKVTSADLGSAIKSGDYDKISQVIKGKAIDSVKVSCNNPDFPYNRLDDVAIAVNLEGWKVSIAAISYDCLGRITSIKLNASK